MAVVLVFGGGPNRELLGFHYWKHPGPINEYLVTGHAGRLSAFLATICFSVYAFGFAPELLIITGGEMQFHRSNLPTAGKRYFYRLVLFYIIGAFAISLILPNDDPKLLEVGLAREPLHGLLQPETQVYWAWTRSSTQLYYSPRCLPAILTSTCQRVPSTRRP
ncbi:hypothetical protein BDV36DRAFT_300166 [Aspergillus pseudocaelatus]|uniref:Amino acid permease/ SLC12A domain-containing protein n=1 Tax=Aspergillus pseudocaelatus TaxID=1825620 RepID=A0ABQ6W7X1_9EURO|nr:hypothetical protein BDV36DRAFT_300166 [Aspergillus pseudocaelatus]